MGTKVFTVAHMPPGLVQAWLQHLRDFDTAHPGCYFEIGVDGPDEPIESMMERMKVEPKLTFTRIFERTKWQKPNT